MNKSLEILLKSILIASMVVLVSFLLTFTYHYVGLTKINPGTFFSTIFGVSLIRGWFLYGIYATFISLGYCKYVKITKIKSVAVNGLIWGIVFFITSEFIIATFRAAFVLPKEALIIEKTLTLLILKLILGLLISFSTKFLYVKPSK